MLLSLPLAFGCNRSNNTPPPETAPPPEPVDEQTALIVVDRVAESYVELVLALGAHDQDCVEAYDGPADVQERVAAEGLTMQAIRKRAAQMLGQLLREPAPDTDALLRMRYEFLVSQLTSLIARVDLLAGRSMMFDAEWRVLYEAAVRALARTDQLCDQSSETMIAATNEHTVNTTSGQGTPILDLLR